VLPVPGKRLLGFQAKGRGDLIPERVTREERRLYEQLREAAPPPLEDLAL
jgi:hypothetical protein